MLESNIFPEVRRIPPLDWLSLEGLLDFILEGDKIFLKMDLAARVSDGILIIDWKTGEQADVDSHVQLSCYGLYAVEMWGVDPADITTVEYNLAMRKENRGRLVPANIDWIKHYIRSSVAAMKEPLSDPEKNIAQEEDFPFTDNELTCKWCNLRKLCHKFVCMSASLIFCDLCFPLDDRAPRALRASSASVAPWFFIVKAMPLFHPPLK